jgi:hypothetical protein
MRDRDSWGLPKISGLLPMGDHGRFTLGHAVAKKSRGCFPWEITGDSLWAMWSPKNLGGTFLGRLREIESGQKCRGYYCPPWRDLPQNSLLRRAAVRAEPPSLEWRRRAQKMASELRLYGTHRVGFARACAHAARSASQAFKTELVNAEPRTPGLITLH